MIKYFSKMNHAWLSAVLWIIAVHSFLVGIALILSPTEIFEYLGYSTCTERFFPTQGGVFHLVMAVGYAMGAVRYPERDDLVVFSILVKFLAAVFLIIYFFFVNQIAVILLSAAGDGFMGIIVLSLYLNLRSKIGHEK